MKNGRRWSHKDGIPVLYTPKNPNGITYAIFRQPPDDPIEIRAGLHQLRRELKELRRSARVKFHQIKVWEGRLAAFRPEGGERVPKPPRGAAD